MPAIQAEAQSLSPSALVSLFQLDTAEAGGPVFNFTTELHGGAELKFGGVSFTALPVEISGMEITGQGAVMTPTLTIANTDGLIQEIVNTWGNLEGARLTRWRTFARFLDGEPDADPTSFYGPDTFLIDRKSSDTPEQIQWELSALADKQGMYVGRTIIRDVCMWRYRAWNTATGSFDYSKAQCPYTGTQYWDENNEPVATPAQDKPSRNLDCCKLRFGDKAVLPFGGFPGIARGI